MKMNSLSRIQPSATPWTAAFQATLSMGFSRQEYWSGLPLPSPSGEEFPEFPNWKIGFNRDARFAKGVQQSDGGVRVERACAREGL